MPSVVGQYAVACAGAGRTPFPTRGRNMTNLECVCGDVFRAQCDVDPSSCTFAWVLLMLSVAIHAWRCCALESDDDIDSDDETNPMYT